MQYARSLAYAIAGVCWIVADFVTWRTRGLFSHSTLADAARLIRTDEVHVSHAMVGPIAALPILGLAVVGLALWHQRWSAVARASLAAAGSVLAVVLIDRLGDGGFSAYGFGAWLAAGGVAAAALGLITDGISAARRASG